MIYNFCEIDDIQGLRLDFDVRMWYNKLTENLEFDKTKYKGEYRYEKSLLCIGTDTYIIYAL